MIRLILPIISGISLILASLISPSVSYAQDPATSSCYSKNIIYQPYNEFTYTLETDVDPSTFNPCTGVIIPTITYPQKMLLKIKILPECHYDQTWFRYEYFLNDSLFSWETTGLVEGKKSVWIHPPRSLIYEIEFSPYFEIRFGKRNWRSAALTVNPNPNLSSRKMIFAWNKNTVKSDSLVMFRNEPLSCKVINIRTRHRGNKFYSTMLFNENLGFVAMDVQFINGKRYRLMLVDAKI